MNFQDRFNTSLYWTKQVIVLAYILFACYGLLLVITWTFDNEDVIHTPPGTIDNSMTFPGDIVVFKQPIQKFRDCPGEVYRSLLGECGLHHIQPVPATLDPGEHIVTIPVEIPLSFQKGSCEFVSKFRYFCNPVDYIFQRKIYSSFPIQFTVGEKP